MQARFLLIGSLLLAVGCPTTPPVDFDMRPAVTPDLRKTCADNEGLKEVGETCTRATRCDCSGPKPDCVSQITVGNFSLDLTGGYCMRSGSCDTKDSATCGDRGKCVDLSGAGDTYCFRSCTKGKCRADYACIGLSVNPSDPMAAVANVCLPTAGLVECDPTKDQTTQCTQIQGQNVAGLTNGNPNAACFRIGLDDVGECRYLPCSIGPKNCPALGNGPASCYYIETRDAFKGTICLPTNPMPKAEGAACNSAGVGITDCGDNMICISNVCRQYCYIGTQPTFTGGNAMFKNAAKACPAGRTCQDIFGLMKPAQPAVCMP